MFAKKESDEPKVPVVIAQPGFLIKCDFSRSWGV